MSKKSFVVILFLSITIAIIGPLIAFALGMGTISDGFPLKWSSFSLLGSNTNYNAFLIDIFFWFLVIWGIWKVLQKISKQHK